MALVIVVSYSCNEKIFAPALFKALERITELVPRSLVVISVGEQLYTGEPEDEAHVAEIQRDYPKFGVVRYPVRDVASTHPVVFHNASRQAAVEYASLMISAPFWALFLDGDEVPDAAAFSKWFNVRFSSSSSAETPSVLCHKLANHWYFLHPALVASEVEDSVLLAHSSALTADALSHPRERDGIVLTAIADKRSYPLRTVISLDGSPMFHHYSWVRADREALFRKVANWGHRDDKPWKDLIADALSGIQRGVWPRKDFVHGYDLVRLEPSTTEQAELFERCNV